MTDRRLIRFAQDLRRDPTDAERRTWFYLRRKRLAGYRFRRQHPIGPYVADFYCHALKLVIELDGGQHNEPEVVAYDARRTAFMVKEGIRVLRFSDYEALKDSDAVVRTILREIEEPPP